MSRKKLKSRNISYVGYDRTSLFKNSSVKVSTPISLIKHAQLEIADSKRKAKMSQFWITGSHSPNYIHS